jgi:chromosome partitioning protein
MKIIALASWKGGTGKTSLSVAAIETLAKLGKNILIIDLDSNLSISSVYNAIGSKYTSIDFLNGDMFSLGLERSLPELFIIPSNLRISRLNNISDRTLKNAFVKHKNEFSTFDYIFIDPPGTMNALTRNAMVAADSIIIPAMFSDIDFSATKLIFEEMEMCGIDADIQIVLNRYDQKRNTAGIEEKFRQDEQFKDFIWPGRIPAMKSISRLTSELQAGYQLQGLAKQIIFNFVQEVVL